MFQSQNHGISLPIIILYVIMCIVTALFLAEKRRIGLGWGVFFLIFTAFLPAILIILASPKLVNIPPDNPKQRKQDVVIGVIALIIAVLGLYNYISKPYQGWLVEDESVYHLKKITLILASLGIGVYALNRQSRNKTIFKRIKESTEQSI